MAEKKITKADETMISETRALNKKNKNKNVDANGEKKGRIISIDGTLKAETPDRKRKEELLKFTESKKAKKVLTGVVDGIETLNSGDVTIALACVNDGMFKIIIPATSFYDFPPAPEGRTQEEYDEYCLSKRLGSEIDYIVTNINEENNLIMADRKLAMEKKKREYLLRKSNDDYLVYDSAIVEARVVATVRAGVYLEVFGCETFVPNSECKWNRFSDATDEFDVGQVVTAKILSSERNEKTGEVTLECSIKQSYENPVKKIIEKYHVDCKYVGTVKFVNNIGVFVELSGGISVLCGFNERFNTPLIGKRATVRIVNKDEDKLQLWGTITHVTKD